VHYQKMLTEERDRSTALAAELATAKSNKVANEAMQLKKAADTAASDLLRERERADALASDVARVRREGEDAAATPSQKDDEAVLLKRRVETGARKAATEQPVSTEAKAGEAAGLLARAKALLGQRNIAAARVVLERAAETGSAQATFILAETYDPNVLAKWMTRGTRGDATKARDLYARAYDGGIKAAKDRSHALIIAAGGRKTVGWFGREYADDW
jgi:hypothetical protein